MKKIKLDQGKLLGFKILRPISKAGDKPASWIGTKLGGKIGMKP